MKKMVGLLLLMSVLGCVKVEDEVVVPPQKLDLNATYVGKITGYAQPIAIDGTAIWVISQQGNDITANVTYENVSGFNMPKFKGTLVNDSTIVGNLLSTNSPSELKANVDISKDYSRIKCQSNSGYGGLHVAFDLTRK